MSLIMLNEGDAKSVEYSFKVAIKFPRAEGNSRVRHMWEDTKNLTGDLHPPGVEVWCMYGVGLPTPVTYIYDEEFPNADPVDFVYADGDDTVDSFSMSLCKRWVGQQEKPVHVTEYRGLAHLDIVFHEKVINVIQHILEGNSETPKEVVVRSGTK